MILQLDDDDDEAEQKIRMGVEREATRNINNAFQDMMETFFPTGSLEDDPNEIAAQIQREFRASQELQDAISRAVQDSADLGISVAVNQLENVGFGFDWTLTNAAAREWAQQYSGQLISGIDQTSQRMVRQAVSRWIDNGEPLEALIQDLSIVYGRSRAELIASTEVTRAFWSGNMIAYRESGVVDIVEHRTASDEIVCPQCGPLHGRRTSLSNPQMMHPGGTAYHELPIHPRCRCWWVAVIE
jgi:SPP1 gp7 family putative phage head morphogenesis protein